jgi:hypothetical protein
MIKEGMEVGVARQIRHNMVGDGQDTGYDLLRSRKFVVIIIFAPTSILFLDPVHLGNQNCVRQD